MKIFLAISVLMVEVVYGQFTYSIDQSIPVTGLKNMPLPKAWVGGLNAAQYNTMHLNQDDLEDLVLFDRMADKVFTFISDGSNYVYDPAYEDFFPGEITNWLLLRDFNCDGKKDIFTGDIRGIRVFTNVSTSTPAWEPFLFFSGESQSEVLLTKGFTFKINLQLQFDDLPAIVDVDQDGDLDIFNIKFAGNGSLEFHRNYSMERYGTCDSLDFERITQTWGGFTECACGLFAFNNAECDLSGGRVQHAGGKSVLVFDATGDGTPDVLFSEASCSTLWLLENIGTTENPLISNAVPFPSNFPSSFAIYPAPFLEDLNFDGTKDLITIPNIFNKEQFNSLLNQSNWFYTNMGTNTNPQFTFRQSNFLQDEMIDVGDNAVPAFLDFDGDGDQDLFISNNSFPAGLALYQNVGGTGQPAFELYDEDFLNFMTSSYYNLKVQFADINKDGKKDFIFTATEASSGRTGLYYIPNSSASSLDFSGQVLHSTSFVLQGSENILIADVDQDGNPNLLLGRANGALQLWDIAVNGEPTFSLADESFLDIGPSVLRQNLASAIADLDRDGEADLLFADQTGVLKILPAFRRKQNTAGLIEETIWNPYQERAVAHNLGGRTWPVVVDLFNESLPSIVAGSILGGVTILRNTGTEPLPEQPEIVIYPNPIQQEQTLFIRSDRATQAQLYNIAGQMITESFTIQSGEIYSFPTSRLSPGIYIIVFTTNAKRIAQRLVIF